MSFSVARIWFKCYLWMDTLKLQLLVLSNGKTIPQPYHHCYEWSNY